MPSTITIRAARDEDVPVLGKYGADLMALHHQWDPERFIPTGTGTEASYARWLRSQLEKSDVVVLAAEHDEMIVGYAYASVEGYDYMALRGPAGVLRRSGFGLAIGVILQQRRPLVKNNGAGHSAAHFTEVIVSVSAFAQRF